MPRFKYSLAVVRLTMILVFIVSHVQSYSQKLSIGLIGDSWHIHPYFSQGEAHDFIQYFLRQPLIAMNKNWQWECVLCKKLPTIDNGQIRELKNHRGQRYLRVSFELRDDANWLDGQPITNEDVAFSWRVAKKMDDNSFHFIDDVIFSPAKKKQFSIQISRPQYFYHKIAKLFLIPHHLEKTPWEQHSSHIAHYQKKTFFVEKHTSKGLYQGPYVVRAFTRNELLLKRVMDPVSSGIDNISLHLFSSKEKLQHAYNRGVVDFIPQMVSGDPIAIEGDKRAKHSLLTGDSYYFEHINFNLRHPILRDKHMRKALSYALNREEIYTDVYHNQISPAVSFVHPAHSVFDPTVEFYPYDPAQAEAILDRLQWKKGQNGFRSKNNKALQLELMILNNPQRQRVAQKVKSQWQKIGIDVSIRSINSSSRFDDILKNMDFPAAVLFSWKLNPDSYEKLFGTSQIPGAGNHWTGQNISRWYNDRVEKTRLQTLKSLKPNERRRLLKNLQKEYTEDLPSIPLFFYTQYAYLPKNLLGVSLSAHYFPASLWHEEWALSVFSNVFRD